MENEYGQSKMLLLTPGLSNSHIEKALVAVQDNLRAMGHEETKITYSDICCQLGPFLHQTMPSLKEGINVPAEAQLERFVLPIDLPVVVVTQVDLADEKADQIRELFQETPGPHFVGLDLEWNYNRATNECGPIATIQYATDDGVVIFHSAKFATGKPTRNESNGWANGILPGNVKLLLECEDVIYVGKNISHDLSRLKAQYNINIQESNKIELGLLARMRRCVSTGNAGLAAICVGVLHKRLDKTFRDSVWSNDLSESMIKYAATDAFVSLKIYQKLSTMGNVGDFVTLDNVVLGSTVSIHQNKTSNDIVALGNVSAVSGNGAKNRPLVLDVDVKKVNAAAKMVPVHGQQEKRILLTEDSSIRISAR